MVVVHLRLSFLLFERAEKRDDLVTKDHHAGLDDRILRNEEVHLVFSLSITVLDFRLLETVS